MTRGTMDETEVRFATFHQAAHVTAAAMLGCSAERIFPLGSTVEEDWGILDAPLEDVATVCAAGYAMERILDRPESEAWARSRNDRALLAAIYGDRTGLAMDEAAVADLFTLGVASAHTILIHGNVRKVTESVAGALNQLYRQGREELSGEASRALITLYVQPEVGREKAVV